MIIPVIRTHGLLASAGLLLAATWGCAGADRPASAPEQVTPPRGPLTTPAEGVGAATCAACHAGIALAQAEHPMARTAAAVAAETRDRWFSDDMLGRAVSWPDGIGPEPRYETEGVGAVHFVAPGSDPGMAPVQAVFGSGLRGLTPVSFAPGARLREMRLSFSRARGGWIPTPGGEDDRDGLGDLDTVEESANCVGCHATALAWDEEQRFDPHRAVLGVQCERCHGGGLAHVESRNEGGETGLIFNPGRLTAAEQVAFCGQCHRQPTDFEPREILARDPGLARHAGASLMMSACFRESPAEQTITCTACHDPHRPEPATPERTRTACLRCHEDAAARHRETAVAADADCAGCHLPTEREAFHGTPFTDHWIRRPGEPPPTPSSPAGRRELAWLEELYRVRLPEENPPARSARLRTGLAELLHIRGARGEAQGLLREALGLGADYQTRMKAGALFRDAGRVEEALAIFRAAASDQPDTPHAFFEAGDLLSERGDHAGAAAALETAARLSPDSAGVRAALGAALLGAGRVEEAVASFRAALALDAAHAAALGPLAGILAAHPRRDLRDPGEAVRVAERLAARFNFQEPRSLDLFAAAHAAAGDFASAVRAAERAVALAPGAGIDPFPIQQRLALYRAGRAYVGPLPTTHNLGPRPAR